MLVGIDCFDVADNLVEIAANAIFPITPWGGAVYGAAYDAHPIFHQALENLILDVIEIGPVLDRNGDAFLIGARENPQQFRVEKDFAVI